MGWASGSALMSEIIAIIKKDVPVDVRRKLYEKLIPAFQDMDCDTLDECRGEDKAFAKVMDELHKDDPDWG